MAGLLAFASLRGRLDLVGPVPTIRTVAERQYVSPPEMSQADMASGDAAN